MHAYFDGCVHRKTSLQTFVKQFEIALGDKIEKEIKEEAACMNGELKCQTTFAMEVQFQEAHMHNLFKKVQDELIAIMYCDADLVNDDDPVAEFKETERKDHPNGTTSKTEYNVVYNTSNGDVNCICRMFNWKSLLCRHAFKVLLKMNVTLVSEKYILRRWRQDVKREHSNIKLVGI